MKGKQFWEVHLSAKGYEGEHYEMYVLASSATIAEARALKIQKDESGTPGLYVRLVEFKGYVL